MKDITARMQAQATKGATLMDNVRAEKKGRSLVVWGGHVP
jgi:hypothetical protein